MMYLRSYGKEDMARECYASLGPGGVARACASCTGCTARCRFGHPIRERMLAAHLLLGEG